MRIFIILLINLTFIGNTYTTDEAQKLYQYHLKAITKSLEDGKIENDNSINIIEKVTKIKCHQNTSYGYGNYKVPTKFNIEDWEAWFNINKNNLILKDDELSVVNSKPLKKEPVKLYRYYLLELKKMIETESFNLDEVDYIMDRLETLVGDKNVNYSKDYGHRIPDNITFDYFENWLSKNKDKLKWDSENQKIFI